VSFLSFPAASGADRPSFGPRPDRRLPHGSTVPALLIVALIALTASATHAPHLPELLLGLHHRAAMVDQGVASVVLVTALGTGEEVWCSVEAVAPAVFHVLLMLTVTSLLFTIVVAGHGVWSLPNRTKPPPLVGRRLRATLQVFRN